VNVRAKWWIGLATTVFAGGVAAAFDDPIVNPVTISIPPKLPDQPPPSEMISAADILSPTPLFRVRGRIEADAVFASQSLASRQQIGMLEDGIGFRRARLGAQGTIGSSSRWVSEFEFSGGNVRFRDVFVGTAAIPLISKLQVGYFREPFSLEGATSSTVITFLERSSINQLDPARNWGVMAVWNPESERMMAALGTFRDGTSNSGVSSGNQNTWSLTGRLTGLPVYEDNETFRLVHIGTALSLRQPFNDLVTYDLGSQNPLLVVGDNPPSPFLPPINIPSQSQQIYNVQFAAVNGSYSIQTEWYGTSIQQLGTGTVFLHGFYIFGSYFPTGEHRGYNRANGEFDRVSVRRPFQKTPERGVMGIGAIELVARFSFTDFSSPYLPKPPGSTASPNGALLYDTTWGVNWYLNDFTRIMANYTLSIPVSPGQSVLPVHTFGIRTAIHW
jgi:phosphate-selective porin OprO/OprP